MDDVRASTLQGRLAPVMICHFHENDATYWQHQKNWLHVYLSRVSLNTIQVILQDWNVISRRG